MDSVLDAVVTNACVSQVIGIRLIRMDPSKERSSRRLLRQSIKEILTAFELIVS